MSPEWAVSLHLKQFTNDFDTCLQGKQRWEQELLPTPRGKEGREERTPPSPWGGHD